MITSVGLMILDEKRSRLYPEDLRFGSNLWSESRLISLLREENHFFFCRPVGHDPQLSRELLEIRQAGFSLVYKLPGGSQFGGMLLLGNRKDGAQYSSRDVQVFSTLANQVNIAVENALNYETLAESKEQLQMVYDKLVQAEKMAALGELTTVLAHELKNPLGIIRGSAQFLASAQRDSEMQQELLHYIMDEVDTLNLVIGNLLGLARHKPPRFRKIDLRKELSTFICQWQQSSEHNPAVEIILSIPAPLPALYADSKQLRQVLLNCVANSEEVMPAGGIIKISAHELEGERIEIILRDTGPGMAEEDIKLVFKKFFTTKEKGVGLGLSVCRQIIRAHNGSIRLLNRSEGGVQVLIRLPLRPLVAVGQGMDTSIDGQKTIVRRVWSSEY
jgi:signal transduction histidine kinase